MACDETNCLEYLDNKSEICLCKACDAIFLDDEFQFKKFDVKNYNLTLFEKISNIIIGNRFSKFGADAYLEYLKSKTKMNFKTALDVGAFTGIFVRELNNFGIDAFGIESNEKFVKLAVTKKIKHKYFDTTYPLEKKFDLICLTGMIMYVRDNYDLLEHIKKMLNEDGLVFINMVNPASNFVREKLRKGNISHIANMLLSEKNFYSLEKRLSLKLIDYTIYSDYHSELEQSNRRFFTSLKYILGLKKPYWKSLDGNLAFILLKKLGT